MNQSRLLRIAIMLLLFASISTATRANAGGELSYQWLSDSTYRVFFKFFRDCSGSAEPDSQYLCVYNSCTSTSTIVTMYKWTGTLLNGAANGSNILTACPGSPTRCQSSLSTIPDYREWWYSATVTLPRCTLWKFATWIIPRNASYNIGSGNLYVEATFNNVAFQGNSSPNFSVKPIPYVCNNKAFTYNNGAIDQDKDSLVTEIINPLTGNNCSTTPSNIGFISATPSYNIINNPIQTGNSFILNSLTGEYSFTPTSSGIGTLTVRVKEYRNGIQIGYVMRDIQIQVLNNCVTTPPTLIVNSATVTGGNYSNNLMKGCINQQLNFCFDIKSTDTSAMLIVSDNHLISSPSASTNYLHQNDDSVRGCFSWIPSLTDTGLRNLILIVRDSSCKPPGYLPYYTLTIPIYIWPPTIILKDTNICPGSSITLHAKGGGSFLWNTLPGGSNVNSMSCTLCTDPIVQPGLTTFYYTESLLTPYCANRFDTVTVALLSIPLFTPLKDTTTCPNTPIKLNLNPTPPAGAVYKYQWTPISFLSNDTISDPIANPPFSIIYTVAMNIVGNSCVINDTVNIKVLKGFHIVTQDTAVCSEQVVNIIAIGDTSYAYKWTNTSGASFSPNNTLNTIVSPTVNGNFTYILKGSYQGCIDSIDSIHIDVQPYPIVTAGNDIRICSGAVVQLNGLVSPASYPYMITWTPAAGLNNPNILNPIFSAVNAGIDTFKLLASSTAGCTDSDQLVITVFSKELLTLLSQDTAICAGDSIQLHLVGSGLKTFSWFPNFNISDPRSYEPFVRPTSTRTYVARGADDYSCTDTESVTVTVMPAAVIYLPDSAIIYPEGGYHIEPQTNCLYFNWIPAKGLNDSKLSNPVATPDSNRRYVVIGKTEFGCTTKDSIDIIVSPDSYIDMPNAFVPNTDRNFIFKPVHLGNIILKDFSIYNRWGVKVFQSNDINKGWDGKYNGELQPMGVYVYTIEATTYSGKKVTKYGNVTLIR
jgi:gliding motility-associated-like protein